MSGAARTALAATAVFAVSGTLSGLMIDEYGGAAGALEWVLRTLVVISAAVALGAAFVLVLRLRRHVQPRPLGWALTVVAAGAFAFFVVQPASPSTSRISPPGAPFTTPTSARPSSP